MAEFEFINSVILILVLVSYDNIGDLFMSNSKFYNKVAKKNVGCII